MKNEEIQSIYNSVSVHTTNKAKIKLSYSDDISDRTTDSMAEDS